MSAITTRPCPWCDEEISQKAVRCPCCATALDPALDGPRAMPMLLWVVALLGGLLAAVDLVFILRSAESALQQAAGAAMAMACAVIPGCLARAVEGLMPRRTSQRRPRLRDHALATRQNTGSTAVIVFVAICLALAIATAVSPGIWDAFRNGVNAVLAQA